MNIVRTLALVVVVPLLTLHVGLGGCDKKTEAPAKPAAGTTGVSKTNGHAHEDGDGHDHTAGDKHDHKDDHGHGATTQLGEQSVAGFTVKVSRDGGIEPGKDAAIDAWITVGTAKIASVRFWIGAQDAKGSVKAKAEIEKDHWHTHVEVPSPMPSGSRLWVEIETAAGQKHVVGFDLKS